jgi:hypothetical protein
MKVNSDRAKPKTMRERKLASPHIVEVRTAIIPTKALIDIRFRVFISKNGIRQSAIVTVADSPLIIAAAAVVGVNPLMSCMQRCTVASVLRLGAIAIPSFVRRFDPSEVANLHPVLPSSTNSGAHPQLSLTTTEQP